MDGVNLKPGWLSDGRSRASNYGSNSYGDNGYRQGDLLSGFGGGSGDSGAGFGQNRQGGVARGGAAPRNASLPVAPRPGGPVVARPVVPGAPQARPGVPTPVAPPPSSSASSSASSSSWASQPRTSASTAPAVNPTPVKLAPPATLNYGKPTPSRPVAPAAGRGVAAPGAPVAPKVPVVPGVVPPPGAATGNKEQQKAKLEERRAFLEQLSKGGGADGEALPVTSSAPVLPDRNKGDGLLGPGPGSQYKRPQMPEVLRVPPQNGKVDEPRIQQISVSREEWDAKWQKLYGSFAADGLSNGLSGLGVEAEEEYVENQDGESLLTEEELASFKARHGSGLPQRRPKQLILSNGFGLAPTTAPEDDGADTSDSDDE